MFVFVKTHIFYQCIFYELINKGISLIHNAHLLHDELESYYIKAMDFAFADNIYNKVINKLEKYE